MLGGNFFKPTIGKIILSLFIPAFYINFTNPLYSCPFVGPCLPHVSAWVLPIVLIIPIYAFSAVIGSLWAKILFLMIGAVLAYTASSGILLFSHKYLDKKVYTNLAKIMLSSLKTLFLALIACSITFMFLFLQSFNVYGALFWANY